MRFEENFLDESAQAYWQGEKSQFWAFSEGGDLRLAEAQKFVKLRDDFWSPQAEISETH